MRHMGLCMRLGPAAASCNVWLPSFFCFLAAETRCMDISCHSNSRKTSPVYVCFGQRSVSKHRKQAGCYLIEIQTVVVWYCASTLILSWLTVYFWLICYCLAEATHSTLVKLMTKKNCFYYLNNFLLAQSHGVIPVHRLLILNAFWSALCVQEPFLY